MAPNSSFSSSSASGSSRQPPQRSKTLSHSSADQTSLFPSPFPTSTSSGHPLKHSATLPSSPNLRTTVLRSRTVQAGDSSQQRSGFIDAGSGKEVEAKVVLLGTQSVGKTSFIHRYCRKEFRTGADSTISANISTRKNYVNGVKVKLQVSYPDRSGGGTTKLKRRKEQGGAGRVLRQAPRARPDRRDKKGEGVARVFLRRLYDDCFRMS